MQLPRVTSVATSRRRAPVARPPTVPGIALCRALAPDGSGPPWRGRDVTSGQDVVLRPLPAAVAGDELTSLPDHPHLTPVSLWLDADRHPFTAVTHALHGGLDSVLRRRGPLTAGETTMIVMAVGRALATLHAVGRVHGSVGTRAVLVDATMRPSLDGSLCRPAPSNPDDVDRLAAEDVRALGALAVECLGGDVPPSLRLVLSAATDPMAALRPTAVDLVRAAVEAVPPEGLRLTGHRHGLAVDEAAPARRGLGLRWKRGRARPRHAGQSDARRRRLGAGHRLTPLPMLVSVSMLAAAVGAGVVWARSSRGDVVEAQSAAPTGGAVAPRAAPTDWTVVLRELDLARAAAFANADPTVLATVDAPGSPALEADLTAVRRLAAAGWQAQGYRVATTSVHLVSATGDDALLDVVDARAGYQVSDGTGRVVASQSARPERTWRVRLLRVGGAWLVHDVA
jgi:hypothetical protein